MTLRVEFLPPDVPAREARQVIFAGDSTDLNIMDSAIYALEGHRQVATAVSAPFPYSEQELSELCFAWTKAGMTGNNNGTRVAKTVPLEVAVAATRGALLLHGHSIIGRNVSGELGASPASERDMRLGRVVEGLGPLIAVIEPPRSA